MHDDDVRAELLEQRLERRQDRSGLRGVGTATGSEVPIRLPDAQFLEEDVAHRVVVVLTGVDQHNPRVTFFQRRQHRADLHEIRTSAGNEDDQHRRSFTIPAARRARSAPSAPPERSYPSNATIPRHRGRGTVEFQRRSDRYVVGALARGDDG